MLTNGKVNLKMGAAIKISNTSLVKNNIMIDF